MFYDCKLLLRLAWNLKEPIFEKLRREGIELINENVEEFQGIPRRRLFQSPSSKIIANIGNGFKDSSNQSLCQGFQAITAQISC
jgi:hypothetical protein